MGEIKPDINKIDEPWRTEVQRRIEEGFDFDETVSGLSEKGYVLDPSGVMLRETLVENTDLQPDSTILDIAFLRKSDVHHHTQVEEIVKVLDGEGRFYFSVDELKDISDDVETLKDITKMEILNLTPPKSLSIPALMPHAFMPAERKHLEISLTTLNGKLNENGDEEITLVPFNNWGIIFKGF